MTISILELTTGSAQISWTAPDDGYETIDQYEVQIADSSSTYRIYTPCSGTYSTSLLQTRICEVTMSSLMSSPYNLAYGSLIIAKVSARNSLGWGQQSAPNSDGSTVKVIPQQMSAPTVVS